MKTSLEPAAAPPVNSIPWLLYRAALEFGDAPFVQRWDGRGWSGFSYHAAAEAMRAFAARLIALGLEPGVKVALQCENRPEWGLAYLAILEAGAVVVPLDIQLGEADAGEILAACEARFAVTSAGRREALQRAAGARQLDLQWVAIEEVGEAPASASAPAPMGGPRAAAGRAARGGDELAALLFTSGTTGRPKGVMLSHSNLLHNVEAIVAAFHFGRGDRFLSVLPQHHAFECTAGFLSPLRVGASIAYARSLKSNELREDLRSARATIMLGVPLLYEKLLAGLDRAIDSAPPLQRRTWRAQVACSRFLRRATGLRLGRMLLAPLRSSGGLATVRMFVSGAAPLRPDIFWGFVDLGFPMLEGYGLTECSPVVSANRPEHSAPGSVGWPLPGVEVRIEDPGEEGEGELTIRGPNVMLGYFGDPEATAKVLHDGVFLTGDLGRRLADGRLVLTGRRKNLIVTAGGKKIYPEEIEARLARSPLVQEVAVIAGRGAHGEREEVHAHVVPDLAAIEARAREQGRPSDEAVTRELIEREVEALCRDLAPFKRVRKVIVRRGELPKTSTGKIRRDALE